MPLKAFANPYTVDYCAANRNNDACIGLRLDRPRVRGLKKQIDQETQDRIAADDDLQQQIKDLKQSGRSAPSPEDIRSFFASVTPSIGSAVLIRNPGEQAFFVVTDIVLDGTGSTDQVTIRLRNPPTVLGEFLIPLDTQGFGQRQLSFESGIVAKTEPGALSVDFISGNGRVDVTVIGYYFTP